MRNSAKILVQTLRLSDKIYDNHEEVYGKLDVIIEALQKANLVENPITN